jgi:REP element-mobilizing transposase RayT
MSSRARQRSFFSSSKTFFGGSALKGNPRGKRSFSRKHSLHVVLKSRHARGPWSFLHKNNRAGVESCLLRHIKVNHIRNYGLQVMSNHIHLHLQFPSREAYIKFIRSVTGRIARRVLGSEKGSPSLVEKFWEARPYTQIVSWGRHFKTVVSYLKLNRLEALGFTRSAARQLLESSA